MLFHKAPNLKDLGLFIISTIISLSNLEMLVQPVNEKVPKALKFFLSLSVSHPNIRNFKHNKVIFLKSKKNGKKTTAFKNLRNTQSENFRLTYFQTK